MTHRMIQGDALLEMEKLAPNSIDAIISDPPYCSGAFSEAGRGSAKYHGLRSGTAAVEGWFTGDNMGTAGIAYLLRAAALEAVRVLKPSGSFLVFCDWRMVPNLAPAIESAGLRFQNLIVWDKGSMGLGTGFRPQHELVLHFTNGAPAFHNMATGNVIQCKRVNHRVRQHPTQKPDELMERLILVASPEGGLVLDMFAGSGSTGVACVETGRRFVGIERDPAHVATASDRIAEAQALKFAELLDAQQ